MLGSDVTKIFNGQKYFVIDLLNRYNIGSNNVLPGIVSYGTPPNIGLRIGNVLTKELAIEYTKNMLNPGGGNLYDALLVVRDQLLNSQNGARDSIPKSVLVFLDNQPSQESDLKKIFQEFHDNNIKVIVVALGSNIDGDKVKDLLPDSDAWFFPEDLDELTRKIKPIMDATLPGKGSLL